MGGSPSCASKRVCRVGKRKKSIFSGSENGSRCGAQMESPRDMRGEQRGGSQERRESREKLAKTTERCVLEKTRRKRGRRKPHRIFPANEGGQAIVWPDEKALVALFWLLEHNAQPGVIALVLQTGKPLAITTEAHTAGMARADAVERGRHDWRAFVPALRPDGQRSRRRAIAALLSATRMQKTVLFAQGTKGVGSFLFLSTWKRAGGVGA